VCFAAMYVCVKLLSPAVSTHEVLFARSVLGLAIASVVLARTNVPWRWGSLKLNALRATFGYLSIASQFRAFHEGAVPVSTVTFLRHAAPAWMLLLAGPMLGEKPDGRAKLAVALGLAGAALAFAPWSATWSGYLVLAAAAGLFAALALLSVRKLAATDHPAAVVAFFMGFVALVTTPFVVTKWVSEGFTGSARDAWLMAAAALLGTLGQLLNTSAYRYARAVSTAVAGLVEVVLLVAFAWLFTDDGAPSVTTVIGGVAILAAGVIATTRPRATTLRA
jgi:drug/metabolite transporter (DMT)-like permease